MTERSDQDMDPAEADPVRGALRIQAQRIQMQDEQLAWLRHELTESNKHQETLFSDLTAQMGLLADRLQNRNPVAPTVEGAVAPPS